MTEQSKLTEHEQAIRELRQRCNELVAAGLAQPWQLARLIDELHAEMLERYTVPKGRA
jgi:hypothetical protein